jgi:hypothetical protein
MVISPRSAHSSGILVVGHDVVIVSELLVADRAYSVLFGDYPLEKSPHFGGGSEFAISPRMMGIFNTSNTGL